MPWHAVAWFFTLWGIVQGNEASSTRSDLRGSNVIAKVIEMLQNEKGKIIEDLHKERDSMEEYFEYCDTEKSDKQYAIKIATGKIEDLAATIEQANGEIEELNNEIMEISGDITDKEGELDKAKELRDQAHEEFKKREHEQLVMIGELEQMEYALKHQMLAMTTPPPVELVQGGEEALLQVHDHTAKQVQNATKQVPPPLHGAAAVTFDEMYPKDIKRIRAQLTRAITALGLDPEAAMPASAAFLQQSNAFPTSDAPKEITMEDLDAAGISDENKHSLYAFADLKGKAEAALQRERDWDVKSQHDFMMEKQDIVKTMEVMQEKLDEAKANVQAMTEAAATAQKEKGDTEAAKAADEKFLKALMTECHVAADAWDKRETSAKEEQAAIDKACEILGSRVKVFLQINHEEHRESKDIRKALLTHLRKLGAQSKSLSVLNLISMAVHSPFDKINGLIKELIENLQKQAAEDANKHAYCEAEKKKNSESSAKLTKRLDELDTRLDSHNARRQELTDNIEELTNEIAEMNELDTEALKVREEQHATFVKAEADFKEATSAVEDAINVLKDFYDNAAFLQQPAVAKPPKIGGASKDAAGGILSILDMMATEFAETVAELQSTEREQKEAYEKQKNDNEVSKAAKQAEIKASESEVSSLSRAISETSGDRRGVQEEYDALLEYIEKLKLTCANPVIPYKERVKKREAEIAGLKEALSILNEKAVLIQVRRLRHVGKE